MINMIKSKKQNIATTIVGAAMTLCLALAVAIPAVQALAI